VSDAGTPAERWRIARPPVAGVHLDSSACSRQSFAVLDAADRHARHEAEVGGYVAAELAAPVLDAGRAGVAALAGMPDAEVVYTTGSVHALDLLLGSWPPVGRTLACLPGEYGPNLAVMAAHGFALRALPTDDAGRVVVDEAAAVLAADPPDLVHLTALGSHRGVVQPLAAVARLCAELQLPVAQRLEMGEANIAARVGFSVAVGEHLAFGPPVVRARLAEVGRSTRTALADVRGWRVVEPLAEPSAVTTLAPDTGADPAAVRTWLIAERRIVTTAATVERAPLELTGPVLRISPHIDASTDDLSCFAEALAAATAAAT
jgi:pyridoxal 5-phosphate dependent beta-lyase